MAIAFCPFWLICNGLFLSHSAHRKGDQAAHSAEERRTVASLPSLAMVDAMVVVVAVVSNDEKEEESI